MVDEVSPCLVACFLRGAQHMDHISSAYWGFAILHHFFSTLTSRRKAARQPTWHSSWGYVSETISYLVGGGQCRVRWHPSGGFTVERSVLQRAERYICVADHLRYCGLVVHRPCTPYVLHLPARYTSAELHLCTVGSKAEAAHKMLWYSVRVFL